MYRDPTTNELNNPLFKAVWDCIKTWDINVPEEYEGYSQATGNHVCAILDVIADAIIRLLNSEDRQL
jgi:hypothetical protein